MSRTTRRRAPQNGRSAHSAASLKRAGAQAGFLLRPAPLSLPQFVVCDEFLAPAELAGLQKFAKRRESKFENSEIISPGVRAAPLADYQHRRSRVLYDAGPFHKLIGGRITAYLPHILGKLGRGLFEVSALESQITASNDGDFFHTHSDNGQRPLATRELTFVYFFHREPKPFTGGELRIYASTTPDQEHIAPYASIIPQQNRIVLFPSCLMHEVMPIQCASRAFADSRFTLNGWLRR